MSRSSKRASQGKTKIVISWGLLAIYALLCTVEQGPKNLPILPGQLESADFKLITRKPILPTEEEMQENSRSQSAKLRVIERVK